MFEQDALLLIGHGSTTLRDAAGPLLHHAGVIRRSGRFAEVEAGMLLGEPNATAAFDKLTASVVHVVPFFLDDGYFTRIVIPDLLIPLVSAKRVVRFCSPVGLHSGIVTLIESRLVRHCDMHGTDPKTLSVLLVGHGSKQRNDRARALRRHAMALETGDRFGWVRIAFLEEPPFVADALASSRGHNVAVVGYLVNEGMHATNDLPLLIAEERAQRGTHWPPVHDLGPIGADEAMPELIMDQLNR